jgi:hypothetical protein
VALVACDTLGGWVEKPGQPLIDAARPDDAA